jgi:hypothetical protein
MHARNWRLLTFGGVVLLATQHALPKVKMLDFVK